MPAVKALDKSASAGLAQGVHFGFRLAVQAVLAVQAR